MAKNLIKNAIKGLYPEVDFDVLPTPDPKLGDYSANIAFVLAKNSGKSPVEFVKQVKESIAGKLEDVCDIETAPNGFINFFLKSDFLQEQLKNINENKDYGRNKTLEGKTVMVEYTDPNPFKLFHIGHLMPNVIGESIARLHEANGAKVIRVNYQGDIGLHVAQAIWGIKNMEIEMPTGDKEAVEFLGRAYALGNKAYREDEKAKTEIEEINMKVFSRADKEINDLYDKGRKASLNYFDEIYKKLGTKFDHYFFESESGPEGLKVIKDHPDIFIESEGAVIFKGEDYGLHTRVFINSKGLPTYEAKELGVNKKKFEIYHPDLSLIVTGNEINDYFKVLLKVMELIAPDIALKTRHIGHGMLRLSTGKMSSRTGEVVTADSLIEQTKDRIKEKEKVEIGAEMREKNRQVIAIGAIRYSILKQNIGQDIIFDFDKSLAIHGDSAPYLQYSYARLNSIIAKAGGRGDGNLSLLTDPSELVLIKHLLKFPEIITDACHLITPHIVATYLFELATLSNGYYEKIRIIEDENILRRNARLLLISSVAKILQNGLGLLGIETLDKI